MSLSLLKPIPGIKIYGDIRFRDDKCPKESAEQVTFVNWVRRNYHDTWGKLIIHPENEGKLINGQFDSVDKSKAMGMCPGASDIIIPASIAFVCEMKRSDPTKSKIELEQIDYLLIAKNAGAFACVALGYVGAIEAFNEWRKINEK